MYYLCSENKGADQLRSYCEADLRLCFRLCHTCDESERGIREILFQFRSFQGDFVFLLKMCSFCEADLRLCFRLCHTCDEPEERNQGDFVPIQTISGRFCIFVKNVVILEFLPILRLISWSLPDDEGGSTCMLCRLLVFPCSSSFCSSHFFYRKIMNKSNSNLSLNLNLLYMACIYNASLFTLPATYIHKHEQIWYVCREKIAFRIEVYR